MNSIYLYDIKPCSDKIKAISDTYYKTDLGRIIPSSKSIFSIED